MESFNYDSMRAVSFFSILFESGQDVPPEDDSSMPDFFTDLNLDQIVEGIVDGYEEYRLNTFFYHPLRSISSAQYRLEVMADLADEDMFSLLSVFSQGMRKVREYVKFSRDIHHPHQRMKWGLDAAFLYCEVLHHLEHELEKGNFSSRALKLFQHWLAEYIQSEPFGLLEKETIEMEREFAGLHYAIQVESNLVTLLPDTDKTDYYSEIMKTFENFHHSGSDDEIHLFTDMEMCALENKMVNILQAMNPECFQRLERYHERHGVFVHESVLCFERELQFYISYLSYIENLKARGFRFSIPQFSSEKKVAVTAGYDLALAYKAQNTKIIVPNDFELKEDERIFVLSGPNQGGKTTFARAFGQILFLAGLGCPVPALQAELFPLDRIFTHFSREENLSANFGRLKDDLFRIKDILEQCTSSSVIIINELFASTTSQDAYNMGKRVLEALLLKNCVVLYITHIHELSTISSKAVSLTAQVDESKLSASRTFTIKRQRSDGRAYANTIVEKHHLTYHEIKERMKHEGSITF